MQWSTEQEYIYALLIQQLNMGSLSPAEIDWASAQMRAWGRKLEFEAVPRTSEGFYVDLASKRGLVRRTGNESGPTLHFLDTTPLADQLERAMHALRQTDIGEPGAAAAVNHATDRDPGEGAPGRRAQPPRRSPALAAHCPSRSPRRCAWASRASASS